MRRLLAAAGLVLVAGTMTACGGAPDDASKADFCKAVEAAPSDEKPSQDDVDEWVDELNDTGTPDDIDDDERNGFEVFIEALEGTDVDEIDDSSKFEDIVEDSDDRKDVEAFFEYYAKTCEAG